MEVIRMSRRQLKAGDEAGFLLAVSDDVAETQQLYRVLIKFEIRPTSLRGRFRVLAGAWKDVGTPDERRVAGWEGEYPTAQAQAFYAALYRAAVGIGAACGRAGLPYRHEDSDSTVTEATGEE
jgi:hypothetical protein